MTTAAQSIAVTFRVQRSQAAAGAAADAPVKFNGIAYSGGIIPSYGWRGDCAIDLSTLQNTDGDELPVLVDHDTRIESLAGKGRIRKSIDAAGITTLSIDGELTRSTEAGQQIAALMAEGYPLQMSVGMNANVREVTEVVSLNGQKISVNAIFEQPLIREVSFVAIGADPATRAAQTLSVQNQTPSTTGPKGSPTAMTRTTEDQALIDQLQADAAAKQTQIDALQASISAAATARRAADLGALFAELGKDTPTDDAAKPYMEMSDASFAAFSADLRAARGTSRKMDSALFSSQAAGKAAAPDKKPENTLLQAVERLSVQRLATV